MNIAELCAHVGPENIFVQNLLANTVKSQLKNGQGEITFVTAPEHVTQYITKDAKNVKMVGMVLLMPIDKLPDNLR